MMFFIKGSNKNDKLLLLIQKMYYIIQVIIKFKK